MNEHNLAIKTEHLKTVRKTIEAEHQRQARQTYKRRHETSHRQLKRSRCKLMRGAKQTMPPQLKRLCNDRVSLFMRNNLRRGEIALTQYLSGGLGAMHVSMSMQEPVKVGLIEQERQHAKEMEEFINVQ